MSNMWSQAAHNQMILLDLSQYGWNIVDDQLECDWDSDENRDAVSEWVGILFRGCSCASVTACSTRQCGCVKKNVKCGPGCRCKHCGNSLVATSTPGTQQQIPIELLEMEQEELLQDNVVRRNYAQRCVGEEVGGEEETETEEEDEEQEIDCGHLLGE